MKSGEPKALELVKMRSHVLSCRGDSLQCSTRSLTTL